MLHRTYYWQGSTRPQEHKKIIALSEDTHENSATLSQQAENQSN